MGGPCPRQRGLSRRWRRPWRSRSQSRASGEDDVHSPILGEPRKPARVLVANHISVVDALMLIYLEGCVAAAKIQVFRHVPEPDGVLEDAHCTPTNHPMLHGWFVGVQCASSGSI